MTKVEPLKAADLEHLLAEKARSFLGSPILTENQIMSLEASPYAYTVKVDGKILLCAGVAEYWNGRGEAWAVLHPNTKRNFIAVHNAVKRFLDVCPIDRIEAAVEVDFEPGIRWVCALGFEFEATCKKFLPGGKSAHLYAKVRE